MKRSIAALALTVLATLSGTARAQERYCPVGSMEAANQSGPDGIAAGLRILRAQCRSGDIIFLPASRTALIGMTCDFTKSIIFNAQQGTVMCVASLPPRAERSQQ